MRENIALPQTGRRDKNSVKNGVLYNTPFSAIIFLRYSIEKRRQAAFLSQLFTFDFFFARNSFAGLVAYRTARFASGLAGASAFTASGNFLISGFRNRLNHNRPPD